MGDVVNLLEIRGLESFAEHTLVFPAFQLEVGPHDVTALYTSMNVRHALLANLAGKLPVSSGEIRVNGETCAGNRKRYFSQIGFLFLNDGLYERLTVKEYFFFCKKLYGSALDVEDTIRSTKLETKARTRISQLNPSEKRRVQFARILLQDPSLFVFEEPDQNVDNETRLVLQRIVARLRELGKGVLVLTGSMETALGMTDKVYRLDEKGLKAFDIQERREAEAEADVPEEELSVQQLVRFEKIPARMNDKMILFNPPEIDYIESNEGQTHLYIDGEAYPSTFKINELEDRLRTHGFFRCHRSYIVNLQKVREVVTFTRNSYSLVLDDRVKSSVPLSKTKMAELKEMMGLK